MVCRGHTGELELTRLHPASMRIDEPWPVFRNTQRLVITINGCLLLKMASGETHG